MSEQLIIGQSLSPSQVRDLPDGAGADLTLSGSKLRWKATDEFKPRIWVAVGMKTGLIEAATLVSLPSTEPKANYNLISEKLAQSQENEEEHSPGEGYRWVEMGETKEDGDQYKSETGPGWRDIANTIGYECGERHTYRRRIEPQATAEESSLVRSASEIEKEASPIAQKAARALLDATLADIVDTAQPNGIDSMHAEIAALCHDYLRAYGYASSIGAIE